MFLTIYMCVRESEKECVCVCEEERVKASERDSREGQKKTIYVLRQITVRYRDNSIHFQHYRRGKGNTDEKEEERDKKKETVRTQSCFCVNEMEVSSDSRCR